MRKKGLVVAVTAMLFLTGCGNQKAQVDVKELSPVQNESFTSKAPSEVATSIRSVAYLAKADLGDIVDSSWESAPLAPLTVIADYVDGRREYEGDYYEVTEDGWLKVLAYCGDDTLRWRYLRQEAIYRDNQPLTPQVALEGYYDEQLPWMERDFRRYLYSADARTCYEIDNEWLFVNDVKVQPILTTTESVEPNDILALYQSSAWAGTDALYSVDYGTRVEVTWDGTLEYRYEAEYYSSKYDTEQIAYQDYAAPPTFMTMSSYQGFDVCSGEIDRRNKANDNGSFVWVNADVETYVDLPNGTLKDFDGVLACYFAGPDEGTYLVFADRVELYSRGALIQTWLHQIEDPTRTPFVEKTPCDGVYEGEIHIHTSEEKVVRLLPDGKVGVVIDGIVDTYGIRDYALMDVSLKDGKLTGYNSRYGLVKIADHVERLNRAWGICIFTNEDGTCSVFDSEDYMAMERRADRKITLGEPLENHITVHHMMGDETWDYYLQQYLDGNLDLGHYEDF